MLFGYEKNFSKLLQNLNNLYYIIVQSNFGRLGVDFQGWCCSGVDWKLLGLGFFYISVEQCVCLFVLFYILLYGLGEERLKDREE